MPDPSISVARESITALTTPLLVVPLFERDHEPVGPVAELDTGLGGMVARVLESGDFRGRKDETLVLFPPSDEVKAQRVLLLGAGKREDFTLETLRRGAGTAVRYAERTGVRELAFTFFHIDRLSERVGAYHAARSVAVAVVLAAWDFRELKTSSEREESRVPLERVVLLARGEQDAEEFGRAATHARVVAAAQNFARDLATRPGNMATPRYLAEAASGLAGELGLRETILDREGIRAEGLRALLAVAQGSEEEPRLIVLEYRGTEEDRKPVVLIGKGVTFDSGGISIKPADRMEEMKYDMSGAAAVLGAIRGIAELRLETNVVAIVPATENLPSGRALKPGDVIRAHLGKTIEVVNTDAEGRLILADSLSYARRFDPAALVDVATLTGACTIALGHHAIGLMGNNGSLMDEIRAAGQRVGERCWPLPLWDEYREQIDSTIADMKNSGGRPAGAITAGWFLKEFAGDAPWAHLDIAGTAYTDSPPPYLRKGASGTPTRLLIEWVRGRAA